MAYQNPSVPIPPNPVFLDKALGEVQQVLSTNVGWLSYVFGRSYTKVELRSGYELRVPMVYKGSAEYLPVQFNDNLQAQSFFEVGDEILEGDYDQFILNFYKINVGLIVWANLKKIDSAKGNNYYFAEQLKQDVRHALRDAHLLYSDLTITRVEENVDSVFSKYNFEQVEKQYFSYPYVGFRFNFDLVISEECI
jgi:hypothetical protein